jgi:regulator of replication initiation timing
VEKLKNLFTRKKTLDSLLASTQRLVDDLQKFSEDALEESSRLEDEADALNARADFLSEESSRAYRIAARIRSLYEA